MKRLVYLIIAITSLMCISMSAFAARESGGRIAPSANFFSLTSTNPDENDAAAAVIAEVIAGKLAAGVINMVTQSKLGPNGEREICIDFFDHADTLRGSEMDRIIQSSPSLKHQMKLNCTNTPPPPHV